MLLKHPWLKPLVVAPSIIEEEEEEEEEKEDVAASSSPKETKASSLPDDVVDREVAEWVIQAVEKRRLGKLGKSEKPALHAAPLDAMVSPGVEKPLVNGAEEPGAKQADEATPLELTGPEVVGDTAPATGV